ncbi:hypothetical protein SDC9_202745 [bioreactor metagenome]|uniref:Uncharacterized protein n=1 Tax=bioreactor metagenome TaxID=1076179 RepID=A0A645IV63_9ZZZZ
MDKGVGSTAVLARVTKGETQIIPKRVVFSQILAQQGAGEAFETVIESTKRFTDESSGFTRPAQQLQPERSVRVGVRPM